MLIHVDTSVLVDAFTGPRRSLGRLEAVTLAGEVVTFCSIVLYEWARASNGRRGRDGQRVLPD
jgi:predicted nucleic acid-binding protein